jgi:uncharacterized protein (TIGR00299 family) protein
VNGDAVPPDRHAWIDATAGIAGDMMLGALVDAGADLGAVQAAVDTVIPGSVRLERSTVTRAGQRATKIDVAVLVDDPPHRRWTTIRDLVAGSPLDRSTRDRVLAVFGRLAEAEGHVHGVPAADIHFHEVGALDSIADIVGVCAALTDLGIADVSGSEVAVGSGRIPGAHGDLPVPAPAVAQLARGWRIRAGGSGELATPTGMALLTTLAAECEPLPPLQIDITGVGAGGRDTPGRPNVTRVILGVRAATRTVLDGQASPDGEALLVLEANVDDLDPRLWPGVLARLLDAGAADAWLTPILMKKGRPAHTLSVLCAPQQADALRTQIFADTSTLGVRDVPVHRRALGRGWCDVEIDGGTVVIKLGHQGGVIVQATPEFETVSALAGRLRLPPRVVLDAAIAAAAAAGLVVGAPLPVRARSTPSR